MFVDRSVDRSPGVRRAQAAAALVELDQAIAVRVEPAAAGRGCCRCPARRGARPRACRPGCPTPPSRSTGRRRRRACRSRTARSAGTGAVASADDASGAAPTTADAGPASALRGGRDPDHRDEAAGLLRVVGEVRQLRHVLVPQAVALGAVGDHRGGRRARAVLDLDGDVGMRPRRCAPTRASSSTRRRCRPPRSRRRPPTRSGSRGAARRSSPRVEVMIRSGWPASGPLVTAPPCARMSSIIAFSNASLSQSVIVALPLPPGGSPEEVAHATMPRPVDPPPTRRAYRWAA